MTVSIQHLAPAPVPADKLTICADKYTPNHETETHNTYPCPSSEKYLTEVPPQSVPVVESSTVPRVAESGINIASDPTNSVLRRSIRTRNAPNKLNL